MGLDDLVNKAKDALSGASKDGSIDKVKEQLSDERIDQVADAIKKVTPHHIDVKVDQLAEQAKKLND